jgi:hypothetical protein
MRSTRSDSRSDCQVAASRSLRIARTAGVPIQQQCNANIETLPASRHICVEKNTHTSAKRRHNNTSHPCTLPRRAPPLPTHLHPPNTTQPQVTTAHRTLQQTLLLLLLPPQPPPPLRTLQRLLKHRNRQPWLRQPRKCHCAH